MACSRDDEREWDKSTSEIQSENSEDLFDARPNRWRGSARSWRNLTEDDRLTKIALDRLRNQDLSVHLYNAFALKRQRRRQQESSSTKEDEDVDIDAATGLPVRNTDWAPPKNWTAWPLRAVGIPPDDFMRKTDEENEKCTLPPGERLAPSSQLEEILSATILRMAKENFHERLLEADEKPSPPIFRVEEANIKDESLTSENESLSAGLSDDADDIGLDGASSAMSKTRLATKKATQESRMFQPTVATDDELSYGLIRPSTRAILAKLDNTLSILHNARMTSAQNILHSLMKPFSDSEQEDESFFDETTTTRHSSRSRSRARARSRSSSSATSPPGSFHRNSTPFNPASTVKRQSNSGRPLNHLPKESSSTCKLLNDPEKAFKLEKPPSSEDDEESETTWPPTNRTTPVQAKSVPATTQKRSRGGRPPTFKPLEGETEREFLIRRAKVQKKRLPVFAEDILACRGTTKVAEGGPSGSPHARASKRRRRSSSSPPPAGRRNRMPGRLGQLGPRDWRDVIGAAALAGFEPEVLARATQRCADLFGEEMELRTITAEGLEETRRYIPGGGKVDDDS